MKNKIFISILLYCIFSCNNKSELTTSGNSKEKTKDDFMKLVNNEVDTHVVALTDKKFQDSIVILEKYKKPKTKNKREKTKRKKYNRSKYNSKRDRIKNQSQKQKQSKQKREDYIKPKIEKSTLELILEKRSANENIKRQTKGSKAQLLVCVDGKQKISGGEKLRLRTIKKAFYKGILIKKNTYLYAYCQIGATRANIFIKSFAIKNQMFSVNFIGYSPTDGERGLPITTNNSVLSKIGKNTIDEIRKTRAGAIIDLATNIVKDTKKRDYVTFFGEQKLILKER